MTFDVPHQQLNGLGQLAVMRAVPWAARTELEREIAEDALRDRQEAQGELLSGSHARRKKHLTLTPTSRWGFGPNFAACTGTKRAQCPPPFAGQFLILLVRTLAKTGSKLTSPIKST